MNEKNKNLVIRTVSALILLPLVIFLLFKGGLYVAALLGVAAAICASEYYVITQKTLSPAAWVGIVLSGVLPVLPLKEPARTGAGGLLDPSSSSSSSPSPITSSGARCRRRPRGWPTW